MERSFVKGLLGSERRGVFIDVGAGVGVWTVDMAPHFERVYAFEPWPGYVEQLRLNLEDYGVGNAEVLELAAWDFNGKVLIGVGGADDYKVFPGAPGFGVPTVGYDGVLVEARRLDDLVDTPFRMLKVDVEGQALHVLWGMRSLLERSSGIAVIEVHNHGESHGTYLLMADLGWRLEKTFVRQERGDIYHAIKVYLK